MNLFTDHRRETFSPADSLLITELCLLILDMDVSQGGVEGKRQVDKVIDSCAAMQVF